MDTLPLQRSAAARLALLTAWAALACSRAAETSESGPLVGPAPAVEFGPVFEGSLLKHEWELEVRAPVTIGSVHTDCGCTLASLERGASGARSPYAFGTPLAIGEHLFVRARYDTLGKRGPTRRSLLLEGQGGTLLALSLAADVRPWLVLEPAELDFVRLPQGTECVRNLRVHSIEGAPFLLRATGKALPPSVKVELVPDGPDDSGRAARWSVTVRLGADTPLGTHSYPIELVSDIPVPGGEKDPDARTFRVAPAWNVQIVGPVALSAPVLEFGLVRADETVAMSVRLESFDPGFTLGAPAVRLEPLQSADPFPLARTAAVRTRAVPGEPAFDIEVTLAGLDPEVVGSFTARLVVETGHAVLPRIDALVRGVRAPASEPPR